MYDRVIRERWSSAQRCSHYVYSETTILVELIREILKKESLVRKLCTVKSLDLIEVKGLILNHCLDMT